MSTLSASINLFYVTSSTAPTFYLAGSNTGYEKFRYLYSLSNTIGWYRSNSENYNFSNISSSQSGTLAINVPSLFYGNSLKRGSINLSFYVTGTLIGQLSDYRHNGELIQTLPQGSNGSGSVAGIVLYNEGVILLTGSWPLTTNYTDKFIYESNSSGGETTSNDYARWIHWGKSFINSSSLDSSSFGFAFEGKNKTPTMTLFAHADKTEFNTSNNPTFKKYDSETHVITSSNIFKESSTVEIKNTVYEPYDNFTGSFQKQTFISKIGIYDEQKNLIAIVNLARPIKKTNDRDLTFKIKMDL